MPPHRTTRERALVVSPPVFAGFTSWVESIVQSRPVAIGVNIYLLIAGFGLVVLGVGSPFEPNVQPVARAALIALGAYLIVIDVVFLFSARRSFREREDARQVLTIWLTYLRTSVIVVATSVLAFLAGATKDGLFDPGGLVWMFGTAGLYVIAALLDNVGFSPAGIRPISQREILDATIAVQQSMSVPGATLEDDDQQRR